MVGEIVTGAVQAGARAAVSSVAEMPVAAVASVGAVAASVPQVASVAAETAATVTKGLEAASHIAMPLGEALGTSSKAASLGQHLSGVAQQGGSHTALAQLAFGETTGNAADIAAKLPERILQQDFIDLEKMGPPAVQGLTKEVGELNLSKEVADNPEFLQNFGEEFGKNVAEQKALLEEGKLTPEEYMAVRKSLLESSVAKALSRAKPPELSEENLEKIKREAAMKAIKQHMQQWRVSVRTDKRLSPDAKQNALRKIDTFEQRILVKEVMKWNGVSVMSLIALATAWIQDAAS